jgi:hypothetical protein
MQRIILFLLLTAILASAPARGSAEPAHHLPDKQQPDTHRSSLGTAVQTVQPGADPYQAPESWRRIVFQKPHKSVLISRIERPGFPGRVLGYVAEIDVSDPQIMVMPCRAAVNPATDPDGDGWGLQPTSQMAAAHRALVAIDGGFFDNEATATPQMGEPTGLLRIGGTKLHAPSPSAGRGDWLDATLIFSSRPAVHPRIDIRGSAKVQSDSRYNMALEAKQWLLDGGRTIPLDFLKGLRGGGRTAWGRRDARAAAGLTRNGKLILCVIKGDDTKNEGISLPDLRELMACWGCVKAMNLDGGGSTTFVVGGRTMCASDNGVERPVSNALLVEYSAFCP